MQILFYSLLILSGILGLIIGSLGCVLGFMLTSSYINTDQAWGWLIILCSLLYLSHPALLYSLQKIGYSILATGLSVLFILCSGFLVVFLLSAIEAAARP